MPLRKKPVVIEGVSFPSITDASVALNLNVDTVRRRVNSTLETWATWVFEKDPSKISKPSRSKRAVVINGVRFESVIAASKALKLNYNVVYGRILSDNPNYEQYQFENNIVTRIHENPKLVNVRIGERVYSSLSEAARAENVTTHGLRNRKRQCSTSPVDFINARTGELIC